MMLIKKLILALIEVISISVATVFTPEPEITIEPLPYYELESNAKGENTKAEEIKLLAKVVYLEAGNQGEMGMRLVIDCVLNRVDNPRFSNTIRGVLYEKNQFTVVNRCSGYTAREDICQLIIEEMANRTNSEVLYFRPNHYHTFGTPLFQYGSHYFSK